MVASERDACGCGDGFVGAGDGVEVLAAGRGGRVVLYQVSPDGQQLFDVGATGASERAHRSTVARTPAASHHLEGAELPVEAGAHGGVDLDDVVGDFAGCGWRRR